MAITQGVCSSFLRELALGTHDFSIDTFKIALYDSNATLNADTTAYSATDEVVGGDYVAGGATLTSSTPVVSSGVVVMDFTDVSWTGPITARGALIYNSTKSNKAVLVLDFGGNITRTSTFSVTFPAADASNAILRISN